MKMPETIDRAMLAPCGMNCMVCYKHCSHKKPCAGCRQDYTAKPAHCRACKLKECTEAKGVEYCHACADFPCKPLKSLDRSYRTRYGASLVENGTQMRLEGELAFLAAQRARYTCPCGGVISLHDGVCSECGIKVEP